MQPYVTIASAALQPYVTRNGGGRMEDVPIAGTQSECSKDKACDSSSGISAEASSANKLDEGL